MYIYGLYCPKRRAIRYIGKSDNPQKRLYAHIGSALRHEYDHHTARWIRKIAQDGLKPRLKILQRVDKEDWQAAEKAWIHAARSRGWPLTNTTEGGQGPVYLDKTLAEQVKANQRLAMIKYSKTERAQQQYQRLHVSGQTEEAKEKRRQSLRRKAAEPQFKAKMSAINKEINARPEVKKMRSKKSREMWQDTQMRAHFMQVFSSAEVKAKQSVAAIKSWADPVTGDALRKLHSSPEVRKKKADAAKSRATPEYRAMMAEKTRLSWEKRRLKSSRA